MSGDVAKRLFALLPGYMPLAQKFQLAENIWRHFGPSSSHSYRVGPDADVALVAAEVANTLNKTVTEYDIPTNVQNRFNWLAGQDVKIKEQLLNHFRQAEKQLALDKVTAELPVLQRQVREHSAVTRMAKTVLQVYKHQISIWIDNGLADTFCEGQPANTRSGADTSGAIKWAIGLLVAFFVAYLLTHAKR
jgi:hypothetical protein